MEGHRPAPAPFPSEHPTSRSIAPPNPRAESLSPVGSRKIPPEHPEPAPAPLQAAKPSVL